MNERTRGQTNVNPVNMIEGATINPATHSPVDGVASGRNARPRRKRISMSVPTLRTEVPEIPGYRLYWFKEDNIHRALDAYYEFVNADEVNLNRIPIGGTSRDSGNTDLGTRVSIVHGVNGRGDPERLVLMKLALEYFKEDQMTSAMRLANKLGDIFEGEQIIGPGGSIDDQGQLVYTPTEGNEIRSRGRREYKPLMNRPKRVAVVGRRGRRGA